MSDRDTREIEGEDVEYIEAEFVNIRQSSVRSLEGGHVDLQQVGALSIDGERVDASLSAAAVIHGSEVTLQQSMSMITAGNTISLNYSCSPITISKETTSVNRGVAGVIMARDVNAENSSSLMVIANRVEGVSTLLDWRSALALGAVIGGVFGFLSLFRRR